MDDYQTAQLCPCCLRHVQHDGHADECSPELFAAATQARRKRLERMAAVIGDTPENVAAWLKANPEALRLSDS